MSRTVGVLGGMGPAATWDFCRRVLATTPAEHDQDHLRLLVDSDPSVPDRNAALAGTGPSPGPALARMARGLTAQGAELLCMPCNAAHAFADAVRDATDVPFVDMIAATVDAVRSRAPRAVKVGLLATTATLDAGLYDRAGAGLGLEVLPIDARERDRMMAAIYAVKRGDLAPARANLAELAQELVAGGADVLIAACTEVPIVLRQEDVAVPLVASSDALAAAVVTAARRA